MTKTYIGNVADGTRQRFADAKRRSQDRQDLDDLTNQAFLTMLLDVWELHERDHPADATVRTPDAQAVPAGGDD